MNISFETLFGFPLRFTALGLTFPFSEADAAAALRPGECALLQGSWYRVQDDSFLSYLGSSKLASTATDTAIRDELELLVDFPLDTQLAVCDIYIGAVLVTRMRQGFWQPGENWQEGDYFQLNDNLYRVQHNGKLKGIGKNPYFKTTSDTDSYEAFARGFTQVTGLSVSDGNTLYEKAEREQKVLETQEDIDRFYQSLPPQAKKRLLDDCIELFGYPPQGGRKTHD